MPYEMLTSPHATRQHLTVSQNSVCEVTGAWILGEPKTAAGQ